MAILRHVIESATGKVAGQGYLVTAPPGFELVDGPAPEDAERYTAPQQLPDRLLTILNQAASEISEQVALGNLTPTPGLLASIAGVSSQLQELARLVPVGLYATEALAVVTNLGELPEPFETVRQTVLDSILSELN